MSKLSTAKLKGIASTLGQVSIPAGHTFEVDGNLDLSTNTGACQVDCPKEISISNIIKLNKSYIKNLLS